MICLSLTPWQLARQVGVIGSSSCNVMIVCSGDTWRTPSWCVKFFFVPRPTGRSQWHEEFDLISYLRSVPTGDSEDAELLLPSTRLDSPTRWALSYRGPPRSCVVNTAAVTTPLDSCSAVDQRLTSSSTKLICKEQCDQGGHHCVPFI
jgi:hypothetical protein